MSELFYYKNNLYWSLKPNGLIMENYYINDGYFTTSIESNLRIDKLTFFHNSAQPTPLPLNPVDDINILFGFNSINQQIMKINWAQPNLMSQLGCEAWQKWNYEIFINKLKIQFLNDTFYTLKTIQPNTNYENKIRAYSPSGYGPQSEIFQVKSWPILNKLPKIMLLNQEKLYTMNFLSEIIDETYNNLNAVNLAMGSGNQYFLSNR